MTTTKDIAPVEVLRERLSEGIEAELGEIELKVIGSYTLADAIREGSTVTTQRIGGWIAGGESCALGAGWIAARARGYI